jgi:hypothetical protein
MMKYPSSLLNIISPVSAANGVMAVENQYLMTGL